MRNRIKCFLEIEINNIGEFFCCIAVVQSWIHSGRFVYVDLDPKKPCFWLFMRLLVDNLVIFYSQLSP